MQNNGVEKALDFGAYEQVHVSMAVKGPALAQHRRLLRGLFSACPEGLFKYTDLKQVFSAVIARYPDLLRACKEATALDLAKRCAERVLVLMNHARRLSCQVKFEQAMTDCTFIQREALTEIRALPHGDNVEEAPTVASTRVYPSAADNMGEGPPVKRRLVAKTSNASQVSVDSAGFPVLSGFGDETLSQSAAPTDHPDQPAPEEEVPSAEALAPNTPRQKDHYYLIMHAWGTWAMAPVRCHVCAWLRAPASFENICSETGCYVVPLCHGCMLGNVFFELGRLKIMSQCYGFIAYGMPDVCLTDACACYFVGPLNSLGYEYIRLAGPGER